jgi:hypothetical protein
MMKKILLLITLFCVIQHTTGWAQQILPASNPKALRDELIQLAGLILNADSSEGLPLVSISIKNTSKGTLTDDAGYFSMVVKKTDTIVFSFIGYHTLEYTLPANTKGIKHTVMLAMKEDEVYLNAAVIRSYPTPEEFNYYFVKANISDAYYTASTNNLRKRTLENIANGMTMDGIESQRYAMQQQAYKYYYNGQLPPNRIFDPLAWGQFYKAVKRGDYKKK